MDEILHRKRERLTHATAAPQARQRRLKGATGWVFVLPPLVIYALFVLVPLVESVYISMTDWNGVRPVVNWIGFENYLHLLRDPRFLNALQHNIIWVIVGTVAPIALSLGLAMLLWPHTRGRTIFQAAFFMPQVLSTVAVALIWSRVYHPLSGLLNQVLEVFGLGHLATGWLGEVHTALPAVLVAAVWSYFGFALTVIMAGLQTINMELIDAAQVDGANSWQRFRHVIVPELRNVLTMIVCYTLIGGFNVFDIVWVMTQGGPAASTEVVSTLLYKQAFVEGNVSYGTSMAMVLTVLSLVISAIYITRRERKAY